jgi:hypothetical protein
MLNISVLNKIAEMAGYNYTEFDDVTDDKVEPSPDAKSIDELFVKPCDGGASM